MKDYIVEKEPIKVQTSTHTLTYLKYIIKEVLFTIPFINKQITRRLKIDIYDPIKCDIEYNSLVYGDDLESIVTIADFIKEHKSKIYKGIELKPLFIREGWIFKNNNIERLYGGYYNFLQIATGQKLYYYLPYNNDGGYRGPFPYLTATLKIDEFKKYHF